MRIQNLTGRNVSIKSRLRPSEGSHTLGCKIARGPCDDPKDDASPGRDEPGRGSGGDKPGDASRTPTDHGPLPREPPIQNHPGHGSEHGGEIRIPASHDSPQVGTERRTAVETKPPEPQQDRPERDERDVVWAEVQHHLLLSASQNHRVGQCRQTRADFDGPAAGVIEHTVLVTPPVDVPRPAGNGTVNEGRPEEDEDHHGDQTTSFGDGAHNDCGRGGAELHLIHVSKRVPSGKEESRYLIETIQQIRNQRRTRAGCTEDVHETEVLQVPDESVGLGGRKGQGVTPEVPLKGDDGE